MGSRGKRVKATEIGINKSPDVSMWAEGHIGADGPKGKREISPVCVEMSLMAMVGTPIGSNLRVWKKNLWKAQEQNR